jgi:hypothetical protein
MTKKKVTAPVAKDGHPKRRATTSLTDKPLRLIVLPDGIRIIDGLGFPPRRIARREQTIKRLWQSAGFAVATYAAAIILLSLGSLTI